MHMTGLLVIVVLDVGDDRLQLRMVVEGGVQAAAIEAEKSGLIARDAGSGQYVLAQR